MKLSYVLAMSAAVVFAPVAQAQITCVQANHIIEAAIDDYDSITGEETGDGVYAATYRLDGAVGCQISFDLSSAYACMWSFDSAEAAQKAFGDQSSALAGCFGEWERDPYTEDSTEPGTKTLDGRTFYFVDDDGAELTWLAYVEEHVADDGHDWHVWVGLDYY